MSLEGEERAQRVVPEPRELAEGVLGELGGGGELELGRVDHDQDELLLGGPTLLGLIVVVVALLPMLDDPLLPVALLVPLATTRRAGVGGPRALACALPGHAVLWRLRSGGQAVAVRLQVLPRVVDLALGGCLELLDG